MSSTKPHLMILTHRLPIPSGYPGCPRLCSLAQEWQQRFNLKLLVPCSDEKLAQHKQDYPEFVELFPEVELLPLPRSFSFLGKLNHRIRCAPFFLYQYRDSQYVRHAQALIEKSYNQGTVSRLHVHGIECSELIPATINAKNVSIDLVDSLALLYRRDAALEPNFLRKADLLLESWAIARWTKNLLRSNYQLSVVAETDARDISQYGIRVIPNGCDIKYFSEPARAPVAGRLVFTGVMNYAPNIDAARYFAQEIFPTVKAKHSNAEFYIVGANPTKEIAALDSRAPGSQPGIVVTGTVPDIRSYLSEAAIFVCPLRSGAGIKNKILAAMAARIPIVSTELGVAGVDVREGIHLKLVEDSQSFATAISELISNPNDAETMIENGFQLVQEKYSWRVAADAFFSNAASEVA